MKILGTLTVDTADALDKVTGFNADLLDGKSSELFLSRASTTGVYIADTAIFIDNSVTPTDGGGRLKIYDRASTDTYAKGISIGKLYSDTAADITTIDADLYISLATDRDFKLFTNPNGSSSTNRLTVLSNGNVGISKANPTAKLQVHVGSTETTLHPLLITAPTKTVFDIDFSGNIGINAAADSAVQLLLYGERTSTTGSIYGIKNDLTYVAATGVIASIYSMYIGTTINANTNFATAAALFIQTIGINGTGTPTAKYGIYQAGTGDFNYFNGATTINSTLTVTKTIGIGGAAPNTIYGLSIGAINGGVNLYGITDQEGSYILSGAGAEVIPYRAYSNLVIGANTLTNWYGFNSTLASKTGGTLTNAYSFYANSPTAATNNFAFYSAGAAKSVFGGNVGIGVTPYAWTTASGYKSLDMPYACFYNFNGGAGVAQNATLTSTGWNYRDTLSAQRYEQHNGTHAWYSASSGTSGSPITFTQAMTLAASGNLLINTTTDDGVSKLQVNGSIITDTVLAVKGALTVHATSAGIFEFNSNKVSIRAYGATSGTGFITFNTGGGGGSADAERMRIDSNGNVAIGTTTSHYATSGRTVLNINGSTSSILGLQNGNDTAGYLYADSGNFIVSTEDSRTLSLIVTGAAAMTFGTSGTERMRIDSNGNVAIGTSSPISKLSNTATNIADGNGLTPGTSAIQWITGVQGYVAAFSNTGFGNQFANGLLVETVGTSNDADAIVNFESGGVNRLKLTGAGNLGIGTTTTPTEKLDVVGNAKVSGTLSAGGAITAANIFTGYQWAFTIAATNTTACTIRSDTYNTSLCSSSAFYARNALSTSLGTTRTGFDTYLVCVYMKAGTNWEIVYPDIVIESGGIVTITFAANQSNNIFKVVMV